MRIGTIHWIPVRPRRPRKPFTLTSARLRTAIVMVAVILAGLVALSFHVGYLNGRQESQFGRGNQDVLIRGELMQLSNRVEELSSDLGDIATREEQLLVAGAGLNIDLSPLVRVDMDAEPPGDDLFRYIDDMEIELLLAERLAQAEMIAYDSLAAFFVDTRARLYRLPSIWPVDGIFVSDFGARVDPFTGAVRYHEGIDLACNGGTPVYAPADGVVVFVGWTGGWGLNLVIRHTERISTRYAHLSSVSASVGQQVMRGDLVARVGSTGRSVAPHLHYEVLIDGVQVDPEDYIIREGPDEAAF
jgi:hypothetical protein